MLSAVSVATTKYSPSRGPLAQQCLHQHSVHGDCFTPGHHQQHEIYRRPTATSQIALAVSQPGDFVLESFPSAQVSWGDQPVGQQQQWTDSLGDIPKDCYYCRNNGGTITGRCAQDSPQGSGKDYMGNDCPACGGTGVCPHCNGDGIMGN